jgi:hypothetical protein
MIKKIFAVMFAGAVVGWYLYPGIKEHSYYLWLFLELAGIISAGIILLFVAVLMFQWVIEEFFTPCPQCKIGKMKKVEGWNKSQCDHCLYTLTYTKL